MCPHCHANSTEWTLNNQEGTGKPGLPGKELIKLVHTN